MSENVQPQKGPTQKPKGLGRGLGSLLGSSDSGAFSKTAPGAEKALAALSEKFQNAHPPAIQAGFVEKSEASAKAAAPAPPQPTPVETPPPVVAASPEPHR